MTRPLSLNDHSTRITPVHPSLHSSSSARERDTDWSDATVTASTPSLSMIRRSVGCERYRLPSVCNNRRRSKSVHTGCRSSRESGGSKCESAMFMRIVLATPSLPLPFASADARWLHLLVTGLANRDVEVTCVSCTEQGPATVEQAAGAVRA